jgi:hypothetical protein
MATVMGGNVCVGKIIIHTKEDLEAEEKGNFVKIR